MDEIVKEKSGDVLNEREMFDNEELDETDEFDELIDNPEVFNKYGAASKMCEEVLKRLVLKIKPNIRIVDLCKFGDEQIMKLGSKIPNIKKYGVSFPTSIAPNRIVCNFSPDLGEEMTVQGNDTLKIDLGVHVDGYVAQIGTTMFVPSSGMEDEDFERNQDKGKALYAAKKIMDMTIRMMKTGMSSENIGFMTNKFCKELDITFLEGIMSHELKRYVIDGSKSIFHQPTEINQIQDFNFKNFQVFCVDVAVSTNREDKGKVREEKYLPLIWKRNVFPHPVYIKSPTATKVLREIDDKYDCFPFSIRSIDKEKRIGLKELKEKGLISPVPVLYTPKENGVVARLVTTVAIHKEKIIQMTTPFCQKQFMFFKHEFKDKEIAKIMLRNLENKM